ncbi:hypothetical protein [Gordonia caeni]|uniref:Cell division protein FtsL n=1 Tax=Gordonia caeni TaxID=1007097 RepID=A0ABP7PDM9_9ACTN
MTLLDDRPSTRRRAAAPASRPVPAREVSARRPRRSAGPVPKKPSGALSGLADMPFIVPIVLLVIGALGLTLYLSAKAAQDSYALESVRQQHQALTDKRDNLKRTADSGDSAPELSDKAAKLGMVPATDAPHLVVGPDGKARLKGTLGPVEGRRLGSLNPAPDPVSQIDASKVDDSGGLGGTPAPASSAPAPGTDGSSAQTPAPDAPEGQAPAESGAPAAPTMTTPEDPARAPAPNVLPSGAATPNRNTATGR